MAAISGVGCFKGGSRESWPVFLVGCHRSGTTLARYILDAHPSLVCPPESKFLSAIPGFVNYPQVPEAFGTLGYSVDDVLRAFGRLTAEIMDGVARRHGKRRWVDKTPNYHSILGMIDRMFERRCLFLLMVRHPFDTIDSLADSKYFSVEHPRDPDIARIPVALRRELDGWLDYWIAVNKNLLRHAQSSFERCRVLRYEDLVSSPESQVRQVLAFIGEPFVDRLWEEAFSHPHRDGYQDDKIRVTDAIHRESVGKWTSWTDMRIETLWPRAEATATMLGYSRERASRGCLRGRFSRESARWVEGADVA